MDYKLIYEELGSRKTTPVKLRYNRKKAETIGIMAANLILLGFVMVALWIR